MKFSDTIAVEQYGDGEADAGEEGWVELELDSGVFERNHVQNRTHEEAEHDEMTKWKPLRGSGRRCGGEKNWAERHLSSHERLSSEPRG